MTAKTQTWLAILEMAATVPVCLKLSIIRKRMEVSSMGHALGCVSAAQSLQLLLEGTVLGVVQEGVQEEALQLAESIAVCALEITGQR